MHEDYERDLDLNLLRVLVVVADEGSVTRAAARLYLTQPAVSAALRRLTEAVGAPLLARQGRGVTLTARGQRTVEAVRPHLRALVDATRAPPAFEPSQTTRIFRVGMSDDVEFWMLGPLLARLQAEAPEARLLVLPVQFRTVLDALARQAVDVAVTVADASPPGVARVALGTGGFVCVYCPKTSGLRRAPTLAQYVARSHVIVSYNGDLRGVVEDATEIRRRVACSVSRFANVGAVVESAGLLATVPRLAGARMVALHPALRCAPLPVVLPVFPLEMLWNESADDEALGWFRGLLQQTWAEQAGVRGKARGGAAQVGRSRSR